MCDGGPPPGTTTRTREFAVTDPAEMPVRGSAAPAPKIATVRAPRGGRLRETQGASQGAWPAASCAGPRVSEHPYDSRRSATPSFGVAKPKCKTRAQKTRRGNENGCLKG